MNVKLPNGTVVQNVPEGMSQKELLDTLAQSGYDVSAIQRKHMFPVGKAGLARAAKEVGAEQNILGKIGLGIGAGAERIARGVGLDWLAQKMGAQPGAEDVMPAAVSGAGPIAKGAEMASGIGMLAAVPATGFRAAAGSAGLKAPWLTTRLGTVGDVGLTSGLLTAATTPGDIAERAKQGAASAVLSMAIPTTTAAVQGARRMATRRGGELASVEKRILAETGEDAGKLAADLRQPYSNAPLGVRPSAAMTAQNPTLQSLELGSRVKRPDLWAVRDAENAAARWAAVQKVAGDEQALGRLTSARDATTSAMREQALASASQQGFEIPVARKIGQILQGEGRAIPQVKTLTNYVLGELEQGVTPSQLYGIRKTLTSDIPSGSELGTAIKFARKQRMELVDAIDEALDSASGGLWTRYLDAYKAASPAISSMKAGQKIEDVFARSTPAGEVPPGMRAGAATMARAVNKFGSKEYGAKVFDQLTPADRAALEMVANDLAKQQAVMRSSGVVGTDTASKLAAGERADAITQAAVDAAFNKVIPGGGLLAPNVRGRLEMRREAILYDLLSDPAKLADAIEAAQRGQIILKGAAQTGRVMRGDAPQNAPRLLGY